MRQLSCSEELHRSGIFSSSEVQVARYHDLSALAFSDPVRAQNCATVIGRDADGCPFHYLSATAFSDPLHTQICEILIRRGADAGVSPEWGGTPMEWALETYFPKTAKFLEKYTPPECQLGRDHNRPWLGGHVS